MATRFSSATSRTPGTAFTPIVAEVTNDRFYVIDNVGDRFLILTNKDAPNCTSRTLRSAASRRPMWKDIVPETAETLSSVSTQGGKLFVTYTQDVTSHPYVYSLEGRKENAIALPGPGTSSGFAGRHDDTSAFYAYSSFNYPSTIFRYDIASRKSTIFRESAITHFKAEDYETRQIFYHSKDGTRVPMFLVFKRGLKLDGSNPTLLYAYGGFNVTVAPEFNPLRLALLEQGFVFASANLRGGGEYGEKWHQAGMKLQKQNVFDDFIAAAEWLVANQYTSLCKTGDFRRIERGAPGGSGHESAARSVSRCSAAGRRHGHAPFPEVHHRLELDCRLRFQRQSGGVSRRCIDIRRCTTSALGSRIQRRSLPPRITTTAWCPPILSNTLPRCSRRPVPSKPVLIRIDTQSGHGASSTSKALDTAADIYSFVMYNLGLTPQLP